MKPIAISLCAISSFSLLSACVGPQSQTWDPLEIQERVELTYAAQLGPHGFEDTATPSIEQGSTADSEPGAVGTSKAPVIHASFTMLQLPLELGRRLLSKQRLLSGTQTGEQAQGVLVKDAGILSAKSAQACIQALLDAGEATVVTAPKLTCNPGQRAQISVINETSYVKRFDYGFYMNAYIADPVIGVARSGMKILVTLHREKNAGHRIQVEIQRVDLVLPMPIFTARTNAFNPVTIQTPVYSSVKLAGEAKLSKDQLLYIATPCTQVRAGKDQTLLLTLIRVTSED